MIDTATIVNTLICDCLTQFGIIIDPIELIYWMTIAMPVTVS